MARVVSLTLFLISWLLLFSYAASYSEPSECQVCTKVVEHIFQQVQNNEAQICPKKVEKVSYPTDGADFLCKIRPQIDKLAYRVCYDLYPDACSVKTPSTKDITEREVPLNHAKMGDFLYQGIIMPMFEKTKTAITPMFEKMATTMNKDPN